MADAELADLTATTTLAATDIVYTVVDPAGTPADRKSTIATLSIGMGLSPPAVSGRIYRSNWNTGAITNSAGGAIGRLYARPVRMTAGTLDALYIQHVANATASEVMRLGIYQNSNGRPGALLLDAGTVDLSTATGMKSITISQAVDTNIYWLAGARQGPTNTATVACFNQDNASLNGTNLGCGWTEMTSASNLEVGNGLYVASVTGALPDPFGSPNPLAPHHVPIIAWRYA